ncbi:hypothetical protein KC338_g146 [Hortaea werneckii]|nr:hypothetical protein KC338_g146 [Hortaea werneckii]
MLLRSLGITFGRESEASGAGPCYWIAILLGTVVKPSVDCRCELCIAFLDQLHHLLLTVDWHLQLFLSQLAKCFHGLPCLGVLHLAFQITVNEFEQQHLVVFALALSVACIAILHWIGREHIIYPLLSLPQILLAHQRHLLRLMLASTALLIVSSVVARCLRVQQKVYTRFSALWSCPSFVKASGQGIDVSTTFDEERRWSEGWSAFFWGVAYNPTDCFSSKRRVTPSTKREPHLPRARSRINLSSIKKTEGLYRPLEANKRTGISSTSVYRLQTSWDNIYFLCLTREITFGCAVVRSLPTSRHHVSLLLLQHRPDKQARPRPACHFLRQPTLRPFEPGGKPQIWKWARGIRQKTANLFQPEVADRPVSHSTLAQKATETIRSISPTLGENPFPMIGGSEPPDAPKKALMPQVKRTAAPAYSGHRCGPSNSTPHERIMAIIAREEEREAKKRAEEVQIAEKAGEISVFVYCTAIQFCLSELKALQQSRPASWDADSRLRKSSKHALSYDGSELTTCRNISKLQEGLSKATDWHLYSGVDTTVGTSALQLRTRSDGCR